MIWKKLEKNVLESENKKYNYYVRKERRKWILDIFNASIKNTKKAYIDSFMFDTFNEARIDAELYI
jgi:hypothetical protein